MNAKKWSGLERSERSSTGSHAAVETEEIDHDAQEGNDEENDDEGDD